MCAFLASVSVGEPLCFEQLALSPLWRKEADGGTVPRRRRYDVVLMNPPFGESAVNARQYIKDNYPKTRQDLYAAFVESFQGPGEKRFC